MSIYSQRKDPTKKRFVKALYIVAGCVVGALALWLLALGVRETYAFFAVKSLHLPDMNGVFAVDPTGAEYWRNAPFEFTSGLSPSLENAIAPLDDDARIKIEFYFYDASAEESTKDADEKTLRTLYIETYEQGLVSAEVNALVAAGVVEYYESYVLPRVGPSSRQADFVPEYGGLLEAVFAVEGDSVVFDGVIAENPDIFGSEDALWHYVLDGDDFSTACPTVTVLLTAQRLITSVEAGANDEQTLSLLRKYYDIVFYGYVWPDTGSEPFSAAELAALGERYEELIYEFVWHNGGRLSVSTVTVSRSQQLALEAAAARLGPQIAQKLNAQLQSFVGTDFDALTSLAYACHDSSCFTAVFTKAKLVELAQSDPRFSFMGVASFDLPARLEGRCDPGLALRAMNGFEGAMSVYRVDSKALDMQTNYLAMLCLPCGFSEELHGSVPGYGVSSLDLLVGYGYAPRYGHYYSLSDYELLRSVVLEPDSYFVPPAVFNFTAIAPGL